MAVLVDTNVILDVLHSDPIWASWSKRQLEQHADELIINPVIYAELCYHAVSTVEVDEIVVDFGFQYKELPREALFIASQAYRRYRGQGGTKVAPLPDFFIGAHAEAEGLSLLTRDKGRYPCYFPAVPLICP